MAIHLFRCAEPTEADTSPKWRQWRGLFIVTALRVFGCTRRATHRLPRPGTWPAYLLLVVGLAVQVWLLLQVWELVEVALAVMELWAQLARLHVEIQTPV